MIKPIEELDRSEGANSAAYSAYFDALARILKDDPEDAELDSLRDDDGRVRATITNVAQLARRKPERLMGKTKFPVLREYILSLKAEHGVRTTTTERLKRQAEDIKLLCQRLKVARSLCAESILVRDRLAKQLDEARDDLARARGRRQ